jgi:hypothetical protein
MEHSFLSLVLSRVRERFANEREFYKKQLGLSLEEWENLKAGHYSVNEKEVGIMIRLFTDYEWMIIQKIFRQTQILPEKANTAVEDFKKMKFAIAKKWMKTDFAKVELVERLEEEGHVAKNIEVRIIMDYDAWGYNDILSFTFPAIERDKVSASKRELIQYMTDLEESERVENEPG